MTTPNDATSEPPIDIADPRWVDDVLARARRRAEESRRNLSGAAPPDAPSGTNPSPAGAPRPTANGAHPPAARTAAPGRVLESFQPARVPDAVPPARVAETFEPARVREHGAPAHRAPVEPTFDPAGAPPARGPIAPSFEATVEAPTRRPIELTSIDDPGFAPPLVADEHGDAPPLAPADVDIDDEPPTRALRSWLEWGMVIAGALLVAFLIRTVAFQAFYIPSESMEHTLEVKDRILVNKLSYKLHDVNRGDIIVFEKPPGETSKINDLIKRVIALPGETIEQQGRDLYIDRGQGPQKLTESYVNDPNDAGPSISWVQGCANPSSESTRCTIPEGHVWVMGDNRGHSHDSRMFGPIDEDLIVGRAFVKVWPLNKLGFL